MNVRPAIASDREVLAEMFFALRPEQTREEHAREIDTIFAGTFASTLWFVHAAHRKKSVGTFLMRAAEEWSRSQGCTEMGSDTWLDNDVSIRAHEALGFEIADRLVVFRKSLA